MTKRDEGAEAFPLHWPTGWPRTTRRHCRRVWTEEKATYMTADQMIAELAKVAPDDANEWRDLRSSHLEALSPDDNARVYAEWRKLAKLKRWSPDGDRE